MGKYEYLTGEEIMLTKQHRLKEGAKFSIYYLIKDLKNTSKNYRRTEEAIQKQVEAIQSLDLLSTTDLIRLGYIFPKNQSNNFLIG